MKKGSDNKSGKEDIFAIYDVVKKNINKKEDDNEIITQSVIKKKSGNEKKTNTIYNKKKIVQKTTNNINYGWLWFLLIPIFGFFMYLNNSRYTSTSSYINGDTNIITNNIPEEEIIEQDIPPVNIDTSTNSNNVVKTEAKKYIPKEITCTANAYVSNGQCYCNQGYTSSSDGSCIEEITCTANAYASNGQCYCNQGYIPSSDFQTCIKEKAPETPIKIIVPNNASLNSYGDGRQCNYGYIKNSAGNGCIKEVTQETPTNNNGSCPSNSYLDPYGTSCFCDHGYKMNYSTNTCEQVN